MIVTTSIGWWLRLHFFAFPFPWGDCRWGGLAGCFRTWPLELDHLPGFTCCASLDKSLNLSFFIYKMEVEESSAIIVIENIKTINAKQR